MCVVNLLHSKRQINACVGSMECDGRSQCTAAKCSDKIDEDRQTDWQAHIHTHTQDGMCRCKKLLKIKLELQHWTMSVSCTNQPFGDDE